MSTICADELFREAGHSRSASPRRATVERVHQPHPTATAAEPARPLRHEDFEARATGLDDLLGGQVFPRLF